MDTKTHARGPSLLEICSRLFLKKYGRLHFLLSCNYNTNVPSFYKDILLFINELKALHGCHHGRVTILLIIRKSTLTVNLFSGRSGLRKVLERLKIF